MKTIFTILTLISFNLGYTQVIIGDAVGTATNKTSVLLEFAAGQNKGIILPYVRTIPTTTINPAALVEGTLLLDVSNPTQARVKLYDGTAWKDLSCGNDGNVTTVLTSQPNIPELPNSKAIIGASSSSADGVLVLESSTKAMVLPMVLDTNNIPEPAPGMMVYINKPGAKRLAVYNGNSWTYWKP